MNENLSIRVGHEEIGRIFNLKENLDHNEAVRSQVSHYQQLGWALAGVKVLEGDPLNLDFTLPPEDWSRQFTALSLEGVQINLGVLTGGPSKLLVLEVNKGEGALDLEQLGDWRAECVAAVGESREQHYFALPPEAPVPPSHFLAPQILIYGEGGLVLVPPSLEPQAREPWRWITPPWESPPRNPKPAVWKFLKQQIPSLQLAPEVLTWAEIYRAISPYGLVLKALLVPAPSTAAYYQGILQAALGVGQRDPKVLLGLLWHAPHGGARYQPEKFEELEALVAAALRPLPVKAEPAAGLPEKADLNLLVQQLAEESAAAQATIEAAPARFDQSVSGQFFQLLAGLGEKVISESCRYEALLAGLGSKKAELDGLLAEWQQSAPTPLPLTSDLNAGETSGGEAGPIEFEWAAALNHQALQKQQLLEFQQAANDFLVNNPDLASDRDKIRLVLFCLRNYISINPECARLSFREKLERAGHMARGF